MLFVILNIAHPVSIHAFDVAHRLPNQIGAHRLALSRPLPCARGQSLTEYGHILFTCMR